LRWNWQVDSKMGHSGWSQTINSFTLTATNGTWYPNIYICLLILITMPVTTATADRSFSITGRVKTYVRSTMLTERLSSLAVLHCYKHWEIDSEKVLLYREEKTSFIVSICYTWRYRWPKLTQNWGTLSACLNKQQIISATLNLNMILMPVFHFLIAV
jgi:hypothetical protein